MHVQEQWWVHCTSWRRQETTLSEHVYCVVVAFKTTEWEEQQIYTKFCIKLERSSAGTIRMIQKATAVGNWWLAASSQQHTLSCITSRAVFLRNIQSPRWLSPLTPQIWYPVTSGFPKTKITWEIEEISDRQWDSGKYDRAAGGNWENCVRSQGAYFEGDWGIIVQCTMFLVSYFLQ